MAENKVQITIELLNKTRAAMTELLGDLSALQSRGALLYDQFGREIPLAENLKKLGDEAKTTQGPAGGLANTFSLLKQNYLAFTVAVNQGLEIIGKIGSVIRRIEEMGEAGTRLLRAEDAFRNVAAAAGRMDKEVETALVNASGKTVDASDIMQKATRLMQEGLAPNQLVALMEQIKIQAPAAGKTVSEAWDDIGQALTTGNLRAARQYVGFVDLDRELDNYARKLGGTKERLTEQARLHATFEIIMGKLQERTKGLGEAHNKWTDSVAQSKAKIKNALDEIDKAMTPIYEKWLRIKAWAAEGAAGVMGGITGPLGGGMPRRQSKLQTALGIDASGKKSDAWDQAFGGIPPSVPESPFNPLSPVELKASNLENQAKALEAQGFQEAAMKKHFQAELLLEKDREKWPEIQKRQAAELTAYRLKIEGEETANRIEITGKAQDDIDEITNTAIREQALAQREALKKSEEEGIESRKIASEQETKDRDAEAKAVADEEIRNNEYVAQKREELENRIHDLKIQSVKDEVDKEREFIGGIASEAASALNAGFFDLFKNGIKDLGSAVKSFFDNIIQSAFRAGSQILTNQLLFGNPAGNKAGGEMGGLFGYLFNPYKIDYGAANALTAGNAASQGAYSHSGGVVGMVGVSLTPKFHSGGLLPDERVIIGQTGEGILSRRGMAALGALNQGMAGGGGAPVSVEINVQNNTGTQVKARETGMSFDGKKYIKSVILELAETDMTFRRTMGAAK